MYGLSSDFQSKLIEFYSISSFHVHCQRNCRGTNIDPWKIIWIDPLSIKNSTLPGFDVQTNTGKVVSGKWDVEKVIKGSDRMCYPFENMVFYRSLYNRFEKDTSWEETELFEYFTSDAEYDEASEYQSQEDFLKRCAIIENVYERIKHDGYRTQRDLLESNGPDPGGWGNEIYWKLPGFKQYRYINEVAVNIGRNGQFLFNSRGHHRLSIAKILNLDIIPVRIIVRHSQWQTLRNELEEFANMGTSYNKIKAYLNETPYEESILTHPDLQNIIHESWVKEDKVN